MNDLDCKVAEARGWHECDGAWWDKDYNFKAPSNDEQWKAMGFEMYSPKTNIAQAMELLEEFEEWEIQKDGLYYVVIDATKNGDYSCNGGWQPTLNKAICRAYLKAKGKTESQ